MIILLVGRALLKRYRMGKKGTIVDKGMVLPILRTWVDVRNGRYLLKKGQVQFATDPMFTELILMDCYGKGFKPQLNELHQKRLGIIFPERENGGNIEILTNPLDPLSVLNKVDVTENTGCNPLFLKLIHNRLKAALITPGINSLLYNWKVHGPGLALNKTLVDSM